MLAYIVRDTADALEYLLAFGRACQLDSVVLVEYYNQFKGIDGVESESLAEKRGVLIHLTDSHILQTEGVDNLQLQCRNQLIQVRVTSSKEVEI